MDRRLEATARHNEDADPTMIQAPDGLVHLMFTGRNNFPRPSGSAMGPDDYSVVNHYVIDPTMLIRGKPTARPEAPGDAGKR